MGEREHDVVGAREVWRGRMLGVSVQRVNLTNGHRVDLEIVRHPGAAAVVPVDRENQVVLVRQMRHSTGRELLEVPAGKLDPGELPEVCAGRELREETGLAARKLTPMGRIWTSPGFTDERIWLFLATELTSFAPEPEQDEVIEIVRLPLRAALDRALRGEIEDAKTVCALLRAPAFLPDPAG